MSTSTVLLCSDAEKLAILNAHEKTPDDVKQDVKNIKEWMAKQHHLPEITDDKVVERFLMMNKFRIERTKEKIDAYYTVRALIPEFYDKNPNGSAIQKTMDVVYFIPLPKLTNELHRVVIIKARDTNVDNFDVISYIAHTLNIAEIRLREDVHLKEIQIYDLDGLKLGHLAKFTPNIIKKGAIVLDKVFTNVSHSLHFINAPGFMDSFVSILKAYLKPKIMDRIFVHSNVESLYKLVPRSILPKDYEGTERSLQELNNEWKKMFLQYDDLFQHLSNLKVKEDLRPAKLVIDDFFGVDGNFKQLNVD